MERKDTQHDSHAATYLLQKAVPFLEGCRLEHAPTGMGKCKATGHQFKKASICAVLPCTSSGQPLLLIQRSHKDERSGVPTVAKCQRTSECHCCTSSTASNWQQQRLLD